MTTAPGAETRFGLDSFEADNGGPCMEAETPTGDQMKALQTILGADRAPYVSFCIWGIWDEREQAKRRYAG